MSRRCQRGREGEAKPMRTRARAGNYASGGRSRGQAAVRGRDEADKWGLSVSVSQRGEEGEPDERDPPVSDRLRMEAARAASSGRPAGRFPVRSLRSVFLFLFMQFLLYI